MNEIELLIAVNHERSIYYYDLILIIIDFLSSIYAHKADVLQKWIESFQTLEYEIQGGVYRKMKNFLAEHNLDGLPDYYSI